MLSFRFSDNVSSGVVTLPIAYRDDSINNGGGSFMHAVVTRLGHLNS